MSIRPVGSGYVLEGVSGLVRTSSKSGASNTLAVSDAGTLVEISHTSGTTFTVPTDATTFFPTGTQVDLLQIGAGQVTVVAASGVTINSAVGLKLRAQWSSATLIKRSANTWVLIGDLSA